MIVLDANIVVYAYATSAVQHATARTWMERTFSDTAPVGLPWLTISAFLRIMTNQKLPGDRLTAHEGAAIIDSWLQQPNVRMLAPTDSHWPLFRKMIVDGQATGPLITDAHLAALTIEYGGILHTTDRDFARFPGLRWTNPLI